MKRFKKRIIAALVAMAVVIGASASIPMTEVSANSMSTAEEIKIGDIVSGNVGPNNEHVWYKFTVPEDIKNQEIAFSFLGDAKIDGRYTINLSDAGSVLKYVWGFFSGSGSKNATLKAYIRDDANGKDKPALVKGNTYYIEIIWGTDYRDDIGGSYEFSVTGDSNKANSVSITASKGKNAIAVDTVAGAKVTVKVKNKKLGNITKTVTANSDGIAKVKISRKLQSGDKIVVTSKKSGYETAKKSKKIS